MKTSTKVMSVVAAITMVASVLTVAQQPQQASAAVASQFNPGNIIDDGVFFDGAGMSAPEVQRFLSAHVPTCYSSYACLSTYRQDTPSIAAAPGRCNAYTGRAGETAAEIIANVGAACNINPKAILVLLQKEMSLVTMNNPASWRFSSATGYSCPDTAACNPAYSGFFYQIYYAAKQYQTYAMYPTSFNHQAGRYNNIRLHPDAICGTRSVFIQNKATAGLYNYTPYMPNESAMANLYGEGDDCASYGNRNFWRIFTDWFGSPTIGSSLMRTVADATVYLVSGDVKYPISSGAILAGLSPLGPIAYVSAGYLSGFSTGHLVGRSLRSPDGTIYFYDAGIKLPFTSCAQAVDYGASCEPSGYVQLTAAQVAAFYPGPPMGPVLGTQEGSRYHISGGVKREILDGQSQAAASLPATYNVLTENAVAGLQLGAPIVRDSVFIQQRGSVTVAFHTAGERYGMSNETAQSTGARQRVAGSLSSASLSLLPEGPGSFRGVVDINGTNAILTADSRYDWAAGAGGLDSGSVPMSVELANTYANGGAISPGTLIKTPNDASVYVVMETDLKPVGSWNALLSLTLTDSPVIVRVPDSVVSTLPKSTIAMTAGSLVRSVEDATVYLVNGIANRVAVSNFQMTTAAGIDELEFFPHAYIQAYPLADQILSFGVTCGSVNYITAEGGIHEVPADLAPLYPVSYIQLDQYTCRQLDVLEPATRFIRTPDGSIYFLAEGQKQPVSSMARYLELAEGSSYLNVPVLFGRLFPTGPYI